MQILSEELTAAQKIINDPLIKLVLRSGSTYYAYTRDDIVYSKNSEQPDNFNALVMLRNQNNAFYDLSLKGYTAQLSYGYTTGVGNDAWVANTAYLAPAGNTIGDLVIPTTANGWVYRCHTAGTSHATTEPTWTTNLGQLITDGSVTWEVWCRAGQEYKLRSPMTVVAQQETARIGKSDYCYFSMAGIPNKLAAETASIEYRPSSDDQSTVKTILDVIFATSMTAFAHCVAYTVVWGSGAEALCSIKPKDNFVIAKGESRLSAINKLFDLTGAVWLPCNDGKIHIIVGKSGVDYDYEYKIAATYHPFFSKTYRDRLIYPNKITVTSPVESTAQYTGSATDSFSYGKDPVERFYEASVDNDGEAVDIAAAILTKVRKAADQGTAQVPMNVGAEIWDYNLVTGSAGETRTGYVQNLEFIWNAIVKLPQNEKRLPVMNFGFGKPGAEGALGTSIPDLLGNIEQVYADTWLREKFAELATYVVMILVDRITTLEKTTYKTVTIPVVLYDGGAVLTAGAKVWFPIDFACTIKAMRMAADQVGSIIVDIWKDTYANLLPTVADTITASAKPELDGAQKSEDKTLTGWTKTINKGDWLLFYIDSCTTITQCAINLEVERV